MTVDERILDEGVEIPRFSGFDWKLAAEMLREAAGSLEERLRLNDAAVAVGLARFAEQQINEA